MELRSSSRPRDNIPDEPRKRKYKRKTRPRPIHRETLEYVLKSLQSLQEHTDAVAARAKEEAAANKEVKRRKEETANSEGAEGDTEGTEQQTAGSKGTGLETAGSKGAEQETDDPEGAGDGLWQPPGGGCRRRYGPGRFIDRVRCRLPTARLVAPDVRRRGADLRERLMVAAQHAASSGDRAELLAAFQTVALCTPYHPRLSWDLALTLAARDGGAALPALLAHYSRHSELDRPGAVLAAVSALVACGRPEEAARLAADFVCRWKPMARDKRTAALQGIVREWGRHAQCSSEQTRRMHLRTLRRLLRDAMEEEETLRPALESLLRDVLERLQRGQDSGDTPAQQADT